MIFRTQADVDQGLRVWQEILGLRDWKIKATLVPREVMENEGAQGECDVSEVQKVARIYLLRHEDYSPKAAFEQDHEITLVHELLHIHLHPLEPSTYDPRLGIALEQAIVSITRGLIALDRDQLSEEVQG